MKRQRIQPEQIYVVGQSPDGTFHIGDVREKAIPWHTLRKCYLYATDEGVLRSMLLDAACRGYMVLDGAQSERRGLRGFTIAVGAWGWMGKVECRTLDAWCMSPGGERGTSTNAGEQVSFYQATLRAASVLLNSEATPFAPTALRWLGGLYSRMGKPNEPESRFPPSLPGPVALMCRRAHVGGPIVHCRTQLSPFTSIDRTRAYGEAMLDILPSGGCTEVDLSGKLHHWTPSALMAAVGVAQATVVVEPGPFLPLLPVMQWYAEFRRSRTLYPTGRLKGHWTLQELSHLERTGRGRVEALHKVVVFEQSRSFAPVIRYLRRVECHLEGIAVKRIEHMLYGRCARSLGLTRFGSSRRDVHPVPADLLDSRVLDRLRGHLDLRPFSFRESKQDVNPSLPLYQIRGFLSEDSPHGVMDRPDRSAWITARNRIEMCELIDKIDSRLKPERSGDYIGRIYVDGLDLQCSPEDLPPLPGASIRMHGSTMRIYRSNVYHATLHDGKEVLEDAGLLGGIGSRSDLERVLLRTPDPDGGPFAGGRVWNPVEGCDDPRLLPDRVGEPMDLDVETLGAMGF